MRAGIRLMMKVYLHCIDEVVAELIGVDGSVETRIEHLRPSMVHRGSHEGACVGRCARHVASL